MWNLESLSWLQIVLGGIEGLGLALLYIRHQRMAKGTAAEYEYNGLPVDLFPYLGTGLVIHLDGGTP